MVERRLELLKMEGHGFAKPEIVEVLSKKHECSRDTVWRDYRLRTKWQADLQEVQDADQFLMKGINRLEQIYCQASFINIHGENDSVKLGALKVMEDVTSKMIELAVIPSFMNRLYKLEKITGGRRARTVEVEY